MTIKICSTCGEVKPIEAMVYNRCKCKPCYKKEANIRYERTKEQVKLRKAEKKPETIKTFKENEILKKEVERLQKLLNEMTNKNETTLSS